MLQKSIVDGNFTTTTTTTYAANYTKVFLFMNKIDEYVYP